MDVEKIRTFCLSLPHVTEDIQWEHDLLFRIGGKIFTGVSLHPSSTGQFSFKCTPEEFGALTERAGIIPAPYTARYHWVSVQDEDALSTAEWKRLIRNSYETVFAGLPKKMRVRFGRG